MICQKEGIHITDEALQYISKNSDGNMRKPLNDYLESCLVFANKHPEKTIDLMYISKIKTTNTDSIQILKDALNNKFIQTRQFVLNQIKNGITVRNLITEVVESAYNFEKIPELMKGEIALLHAETEIQIITGAVDIVVITGFLAKLGKIGSKYLKKE
jgi:DNA polymerase III delta prime subunit